MIAVKGCKVGEWNGRSLGSLSSSQLITNPDCADAHRLRGWYDAHGSSTSFKAHSGDGSSGGPGSKDTDTDFISCYILYSLLSYLF